LFSADDWVEDVPLMEWLKHWVTVTRGTLLTRVLALILTMGLGGLIFFAVDYFKFQTLVEDLEWKTYDLRAFLQNGPMANKPSDDVVIVKFDDPTLNNYEDEFGHWPWPRSVHAEMMDWMDKVGVRAMAYDIMFISSRKGDEASDQALVDAFKRHNNVYMSMNFDNNEATLQKLGKALTAQEYEEIQGMSLPLINRLGDSAATDGSESSGLNLDVNHAFYDGLTFNNYRKILPGLLQVPRRLGIVNHVRGKDGISRGNPLVFRLSWQKPVISPFGPYRFNPKAPAWTQAGDGVLQQGRWFDRKGNWVDPQGCFMIAAVSNTAADTYQCKTIAQQDYYPYLGLRLALDMRFTPQAQQHVELDPNGNLIVGDGEAQQRIPLSAGGILLAKWYNINIDQQQDAQNYQELTQYRNSLMAENKPDLAKLQHVNDIIERLRTRLGQEYLPKPYREISAWQVIKALRNEAKGALTQEDIQLKALLKDKIVFIGTTAVSTFDIKTTPISRVMPGVLLQAMVFDNVYQNNGYLKRADNFTNITITGLLCLISGFFIIKLRSAIGGLAIVLGLVAIYISLTIFAYHHFDVWLNMAAPIISMTVITIITFMVKYVSRDQDYEKTYVMATTDAMTGLKNHRFFQDRMRESVEMADKFNGKFSLVLIDIDHFKKFNDTYGHQAGDEVLRAVARKLQQSVRSNDLVARYGGEEMAVVLDKANEEEAIMVAKKLVDAVASEPYAISEGVSKHVTISAGVATYPSHGQTPAELIEFSDKGLYRAKENGRNQVGAQYDEPKATTNTEQRSA